ncbi:MAG: RsmE family RNA methyltransferase [Dehalococcoidales bacterium]|nr:RsmE family RNA methyltransferase [Dehalococcoidales bacterium]
MNRFFIPKEWLEADGVNIYDEAARQIINVLRLKVNDRIVVLDNTGVEYRVNLDGFTKDTVHGTIEAREPSANEPHVKITLYQSLLKADKFEYVLQKGVELGVTAFVPVISARCIAKKESAEKRARWEKIIKEAAEQSERGIIPELKATVQFTQSCETVNPLSIMLWEQEDFRPLAKILRKPDLKVIDAVNLFVGPEGGYTEREADHAREHGILTASLGKRILRADTAGIVAVTAVMYDQNELG